MKNVLQIAAAAALLVAIVFGFGCYHFVPSVMKCGACSFIYNFQTLIAGVLALLAALVASLLVFEQIRVARVQSSAMTRDVLIQRLRNVGARKRTVASIVGSITEDFERAIYPNPETNETNINPQWAHGAEQHTSQSVTKLRRIQNGRSDPAAIFSAIDGLALVAERLAECLYVIPIPAIAPWDHDECTMNEAEIAQAKAEAEATAKIAEGELPNKITAVSRAGRTVDIEYEKLLHALRTQLRNIDDTILSDGT